MDIKLLELLDSGEMPNIRCHDVVVYDNNTTYDRYSIYLQWASENDMWDELISSSMRPTHPLGFWSVSDSLQFDYDVDSDNEHLGKQIDFRELPKEVQDSVVAYIKELEREMNK